MSRRRAVAFAILGIMCFTVCGHDCLDVDTRSPSAVRDLTVSTVTHHSVELTWTAPGDDGASGRASQYDIRYARYVITDTSWGDAVRCGNEPSPGAAGTDEVFTVFGLSDYSEYSFAIKVADEVPNWSGLSNVSTCRTAVFDTMPPVIDSIAVPNCPPPVPCQHVTVYAHDAAGYPEAVTPPESLEFWYRLTDPTGTPTCESEPEWSSENWKLEVPPCLTTNGTYTFECRVRDGFLNESDLATAEFSVVR